jgi:hypothetical protein
MAYASSFRQVRGIRAAGNGYLRRSDGANHGLIHGCKRAGKSLTMAMATVNGASLLAIVEACVYVFSRRGSWLAARQAIQHGLAVSDRLDCYIEERLLGLADGLPPNGF